MTQAQKSLYDLLIRTNKLSREAGESYLAKPRKAFSEIVEASSDEVAENIVEESKNNTLYRISGIGDEAGQIEVLLWLIYFRNGGATNRDGIKDLERWVKLREVLSSLIGQGEDQTDKQPKGSKSKTAKNYLLATGKVMSILPKMQAGDTAKVEVIHKRKKAPAVHTIVHLPVNSDAVQIKGHLEAFDLSILDGITSLLACENDFITADMAYRATTGNTESKSITKAQRQDTLDSIFRLLHTPIEIDASDEAKAYREDITSFKLSDNLLSAQYVEAEFLNGVAVSGFKFKYEKDGKVEMPLHYKYALLSGQIATIPVQLLDLPINNTKSNIVLRDYLLKMIGAMKNPKANMGHKISFASIYEVAGLPTDSPSFKTEAKRVRETTFKMLDEWQKKNHINGYTTYKDGKTIAGVSLSV